MKDTVCIIGYGSIGNRHHNILKKFFKKNQIYIITNRPNITNSYQKVSSLKKLDPKYIFVCNETSKHYDTLKYIDNNFKNKIVFIEKPLFEKFLNYKPSNNKYFVGYNMRFNPILTDVKNYIKSKKIYSVDVICASYLPNWRKNRDYRNTYSASKKKGGGVLLDLSHEFDYIKWIFGEFNIIYSYVNKISNFEISSEDYASIFLKTKNNININVTLNYFSKINKREILINGKNFSLSVDLINKKTITFLNRSILKKYYFDINKSYKLQIEDLIKNQYKICSYKEALNLMGIIDKMRNKL